MTQAAQQSKHSVLGVRIDALEYEGAVTRVVDSATGREPLSLTALAVHGVMTGVFDRTHRYRLNHLDVVTPDGQPVRWALNLRHRSQLKDRVYGPLLMLKVCEAAAREQLPVFLFGSRSDVLELLEDRLPEAFPGLVIAGTRPSLFRTGDEQESAELATAIRDSGASICFVGLGCPRQEIFVFENRDRIGIPLLAVGAAFEYHAGLTVEPPEWMQRAGLQWFHRLLRSPRRLWKRYLVLNPAYVALFSLQMSRIWRPDERGERPASSTNYL